MPLLQDSLATIAEGIRQTLAEAKSAPSSGESAEIHQDDSEYGHMQLPATSYVHNLGEWTEEAYDAELV
jgi:hypothetical protein